jgi:hypothetical protein
MPLLPTADSYQKAILNPSLCFSDTELKGGKTHTNKQGLALPWSGQFASVFRVQTNTGIRAVKCFTSQISDHQDRYARLHLHIDKIGSKSLPMLAAFEYQPNGIRVNGGWYPIVKMEWVNGEKLDEHVEKLVKAGDTGKLNTLANQWLNLITGLQQNQIAHGDLQHENILVNNGYLRLVDYDGAYVPSLSGRIGLEIGHPNYKHPRRNVSDFNLNIDNFSAIVIYLSLRALSVDPSLWGKFHKDKCLILREDDYKSPTTSPVITQLKMSKDAEVCKLASTLEIACKTTVSAVPNLNLIVASASPTASTPTDWRSSWSGMEPATLPNTPPYTPPPSPPPQPQPTYIPPQWQTSTPVQPPHQPVVPLAPKKSYAWLIAVGVIICLCLSALGIMLIANNISNQNAQATAIAQSMTATAWAIPFYSQTFDSAPEWEWDDGSGIKYVVEYGIIRGEVTKQMAAWTFAGQSLNGVKIDVDVEKLINGTDNNEMGVICNATDSRHFYAFVIGSNQSYQIWRQDGDNSTQLVEWNTSSVINSGTISNHLTAICNNGNLTLIVNGIELASISDTTYTQGDVGIVVGSYDENLGMSAYFDNFNLANP